MRIGVRARCQRQGIGRTLMEYLLVNYSAHLSLDVSTDNEQAISFYHRLGLIIDRTYITEEEKVEFASFATPEDFVYRPRTRIPKIEAKIDKKSDDVTEVEEVKQGETKADKEDNGISSSTTLITLLEQAGSALTNATDTDY